MATETSNLTAEFETFVMERVKSGRYASASEAYRAAKASLERRELYDEKLANLRRAIADGEASGIAEGDVFARVRERAGLPPRVRS